jgi:arginine repressor
LNQWTLIPTSPPAPNLSDFIRQAKLERKQMSERERIQQTLAQAGVACTQPTLEQTLKNMLKESLESDGIAC